MIQARTIFCLLALACTLAGAEATTAGDVLPGIENCTIRYKMEFENGCNISLNLTLPNDNLPAEQTRFRLDPGKSYALILIESPGEQNA